jgi:hypothetical protein
MWLQTTLSEAKSASLRAPRPSRKRIAARLDGRKSKRRDYGRDPGSREWESQKEASSAQPGQWEASELPVQRKQVSRVPMTG